MILKSRENQLIRACKRCDLKTVKVLIRETKPVKHKCLIAFCLNEGFDFECQKSNCEAKIFKVQS